jgi:hypothetical protein
VNVEAARTKRHHNPDDLDSNHVTLLKENLVFQTDKLSKCVKFTLCRTAMYTGMVIENCQL